MIPTGDERIPLLILGLGNIICGDDGVGIRAVEGLLEQYELPEGVEALDGGTLGLTLLPWLQDADRVILVDAVAGDGPPGTLLRLEGTEVSHAAAHRLSVHQIGVHDLLAGTSLSGQEPEALILCGVVPESMELTVDLSDPVAASVPALIEQVAAEAAALGFPLKRLAA